MRIFLADCERVLLMEIGDKHFTRKSVALTYAMATESYKDNDEQIDWGKVHEAIVRRWSFSGLEFIKNTAYNLRKKRQAERVSK